MTRTTAVVVELKPKAEKAGLICSDCYAVASCDCGAQYLKPDTLAKKMIKQHPDWGDQKIADEIGVARQTVRRAREQSGSPNGQPETRIGKDGKKYKAKKKKKPPSQSAAPQSDGITIIQEPCEDCNTEEEHWQRSVMLLAGNAIAMPAFWTREFGKWDAFDTTSEMILLAEQAAASWQQVVVDLKRRKCK